MFDSIVAGKDVQQSIWLQIDLLEWARELIVADR